MELKLTKPIVFFDLETTGVQVGSDHIVQICMFKVNPDGSKEIFTTLVRPADIHGNTLPIPPETTDIHGISDADVAGEKSFRELADEILEFLGNADLAGYNSNKFDIPMLVEEFLRAEKPINLKNRRFVDVQNIFHKMEPRTLKGAYKFYCGKDLENAHSADADTMATYEVLKSQLDMYQGVTYVDRNGTESVPVVNDVEALAAFSRVNPWADLCGHITYDARHREVFNFGKHKGVPVETVFEQEPAYYDWMMKADFPLSTKEVISDIKLRMNMRKLEALKDKFGGR